MSNPKSVRTLRGNRPRARASQSRASLTRSTAKLEALSQQLKLNKAIL